MDAVASIINTLLTSLVSNPLVSLLLLVIMGMMAALYSKDKELLGERDRYDAQRTAMQTDIKEINEQYGKLQNDFSNSNISNGENLLKMGDALVRVTEAVAKGAKAD